MNLRQFVGVSVAKGLGKVDVSLDLDDDRGGESDGLDLCLFGVFELFDALEFWPFRRRGCRAVNGLLCAGFLVFYLYKLPSVTKSCILPLFIEVYFRKQNKRMIISFRIN